MSNRRITTTLFVLLLIGLFILFTLTKPSGTDKFYQSLSDVLIIEKSAIPITKKIQVLLKEENDLYDMIAAAGKEERDVTDDIKKVNETIYETSDLFTTLTEHTKDAVKQLQVLQKNAQKIQDNTERNRAIQVVELFENRWNTLNKMEKSYKKLADKEKELYENLGNDTIDFDELEKILDEIEKTRKSFNDYAKKYDAFGDEINQILEK